MTAKASRAWISSAAAGVAVPVGDADRGLRQPPPGHELHGEAG